MTTLSPAQVEAFEKAQEILGEHFECWTMAVETSLDERDEEGEEVMFWRGSFSGGRSRALGLTTQHLDDLRRIRKAVESE